MIYLQVIKQELPSEYCDDVYATLYSCDATMETSYSIAAVDAKYLHDRKDTTIVIEESPNGNEWAVTITYKNHPYTLINPLPEFERMTQVLVGVIQLLRREVNVH